MAGQIFQQVNLSKEYLKIRWKEPYVSDALNKKMFGVFAKGIYSGFVITTSGLGRDISVGAGSVSGGLGTGMNSGYVSGGFDETVGFSIAVQQSTGGYSKTLMLPLLAASIQLDATGLDGQRVYVILDSTYAIGSESSVRCALVNGEYIDQDPSVLVVGHVDVPANPLDPITSVNIGYDDPVYPRLTPLANPNKAGFMPTSVWAKLDQFFAWEDLCQPNLSLSNSYIIELKPSQRTSSSKRVYTYINPVKPSKFPRDAAGDYNGGVSDDQVTLIDVVSGLIGGAHLVTGNSSISTSSVSGNVSSFQVGLIAISQDDELFATYGLVHATLADAIKAENLPKTTKEQMPICFFVLETDGSGVIQPLTAASILDARPFLSASNKNLEMPLRAYAGDLPDSKLYFSGNVIKRADGTSLSTPPLSANIPEISEQYVDFQAQTTSANVSVTFPTSTVGYFRRCGFTLQSDGVIRALFTPEDALLPWLANAGTVFSNGLPICYVDLECTDSAGKFKTAGSSLDIIENEVAGESRIFMFGTGSGGAGTGDANTILETLKNHFVSSMYEFLTPNIFSQDKETYKDTSAAVYDFVTNSFRFQSTGDDLVLNNSLDFEFASNDGIVGEVDLVAFWNSTGIDSNATYSLSRDNGVTFYDVTMDRIGNTEVFKGSMIFSREPNANLITLTSGTGATATDLNATTQARLSSKITVVDDYKVAMRAEIPIIKTGSPLGYITVSLIEDNAGLPSTSATAVKARSAPVLASSLTTTLNVDFSDIYLSGAYTYHLVIEGDALYRSGFSGSNKIQLSRGSTAASGGSYNQSTGVWSSANNLNFTLLGIDQQLKIKVVSSDDNRYLDAIGVLYGKTSAPAITGIKNIEVFKFSGSLDQTAFTVSNFPVDVQNLKVYDTNTGQVYRFPAFTVVGQTVNFTSGQFLDVGNTITLVFDQSTGGGFDNSDTNAALLAANFLGSTDATLDRSVAGRGIFLRRPDGTLREIAIDDNDNIVVYSV